MSTKRKNRRYEELPLTMEEVLQRDNIPASEPVPGEIAEKLASNRIVLSSDDEEFDPRKYFTKIKGSKGAWELSTKEPVMDGMRVEKMELVEPASVKRAVRGSKLPQAFRPLWQPYIYHPKAVTPNIEPRMLKRKSGAKVRPDAVFNRDDREGFLPDGYPWHCIGSVVVDFPNGAQNKGTGTLVGSRTVLCAAHMIPWSVPGVSIRFYPGYFTFAVIMPSILRAANGRPMSSFVTNVRGYNVSEASGWDVAVMRLVEPLGDWLGTFGTQVYNDDWEDQPRWTSVGYPYQWGSQVINIPFVGTFVIPRITGGNVPTRQFGISVEDDDADGDALELENYADTSPGNSGGPLFGFWPNGAYVIGVNSGNEITDVLLDTSVTNIAAGGNAMVNLVSWARATWV